MTTPLHRETVPAYELERELGLLIVNALKLDILSATIDPVAPLFGEGLGLDSIDMLELALVVSKTYGVELRSENRAAFASLRALAEHIHHHRTK